VGGGGGGGGDLTTARVSMLLKSRAFLTSFRACFLPGRAKNLSAPLYISAIYTSPANHLVLLDLFNLTILCEHDLRATFKAGNFLASLSTTGLPKKDFDSRIQLVMMLPLVIPSPVFSNILTGLTSRKKQGKALSLNSVAAELFWNPCQFND